MNWQEVFHVGMYHGYIPQILLAEFVFFMHGEFRSHPRIRICIGLPVVIILSIIVPNLIAYYVSGFFSMTIFFLSMGFWAYCMKADLSELVFNCVAGQLVQNLSYHVENLVYLPLSEKFTLMGRLFWSLVCLLIVYTAAFFFLARRQEGQKTVYSRFIFTFSIITTIFVYEMQYLFQVYRIDTLWVTRPPLILCCIFGLCVQFGYLALGREKENNLVLEQMIANEHRQYELAKESMDVINRKAHDLKHQLLRMRAMASADEKELQEIEEAVGQYELTYHTGNPTLDTILSEKQWICGQNHIEFSVMAQGEILDFLRPGEIASLFGNAIDNAIECEKGIAESAKRCIALQLFETMGLVCLRVENYCPQEIVLDGELPKTTKSDREDHGFGLRSIKYIAEQHNGTMHIIRENRMFVLNVLMQPK